MVLNHSTVNVFMPNSQIGDVVNNQSETTIKGNKTTIKDSRGNITAASTHVNQVSADGIDVARIREFADLVAQIAPTLGLAPDQLDSLQSSTRELQTAATEPDQDRGRFRRAIDRVLGVLKIAGPTAARAVAIGMGEELLRELGGDALRQLGH